MALHLALCPLFQSLACANCHKLDAQGRCPNLRNLYGTKILLSDGSQVTFNDDYIRESIVNPSAKVVSGFEPIMPTFQGLVTEENVLQLIEYIKALTPKPGAPTPGAPPPDASGKLQQIRKQSKQVSKQ